MQSKSPKDYWNYINSLNTRRQSCDVNLEVFFDYFKNLNADNVSTADSADADFPNITLNHNLNEAITVEEITKAIENL